MDLGVPSSKRFPLGLEEQNLKEQFRTFLIMATIFNTSEYQQIQIDSLLNSPTKPQSLKFFHCKTGRNLCPPSGRMLFLC